MPEIDWVALAELEDMHYGWRSAFPSLGSDYVPGEGDNPQAFLIGEAPGAQEAIKHRPFVGPAGRVLRDLMALAGLQAEPRRTQGKLAHVWDVAPANCWLTNVVKFKPPKNRKPTPSEVKSVRSLLREEWQAVGSPKVIVPIGGTALGALYGQQISITAVSGNVKREVPQYHDTGHSELFVWPMLHPSYVLRSNSDELKAIAEADWERFGRWRNELGV